MPSGSTGRLLVGLASLSVLVSLIYAVHAWTPLPGTNSRAAGGAPQAHSEPDIGPEPTDAASDSTHPVTGPGRFVTAPGESKKVGKGKALHYRVEVEKGIPLSAAVVAGDVERILSDPRGWTADGHSAFRRVSAESGTDFVVRLATPGTVDRICGQYGLDTGGEVNCRVNRYVMVNLKRWEQATPVYAKSISAYRALIINHEVGHFLGHGHVGCPGQGEPAPAMMQQIKGMHGCVPNVWPYDDSGRHITGPSLP